MSDATIRFSSEFSPSIAMVTGGVKRIGAEMTLLLISHGWHVVVHHRAGGYDTLLAVAQARWPDLTPETIHAQTTLVSGDLRDQSCLAELIETAAALGSWNVLINSASQFEPDLAMNATPQALLSHWQANLAAPLALSQGLYTQQTQGQARILNFLDHKLWALNPEFFSYTLSKAALLTATQTMAQAFAPHIAVYGIAPGLTLPSVYQSEAEFTQLHTDTPTQRGITLEELCAAVRFLLSGYPATGQSIIVDHGVYLLPPEHPVGPTALHHD